MTLLIGAWLVLMCLKTIGHGYDAAVQIHNLRVAAQRLRLRYDREVQSMKREAILAANRRMERQFGRLSDMPVGSGSEPTPEASAPSAKAA